MPIKKLLVHGSWFMVQRIVAILVVLVTCYLLLVTPTFAQTQTASVSALPSNISTTSPIYTQLLVHNMFHTFYCLSLGQSFNGQPCLTYKVTQDATGAIQTIPVLSQVDTSGGLMGATSGILAGLFVNSPVKTSDYLASIGSGLGIVKEANAEVVGSGEGVLNPIIKLWQVSRNIAYIVMILIFVIIGFMVMFRQRINPQTVITAQAALPGLIIGLMLITFSYFFAALISDVAFLGTNIVGYYFSSAAHPGAPAQDLLRDMSDKNENILTIFSRYTGIIDQEKASSALDAIFVHLGFWTQSIMRVVAGAFVFQQVNQGAEVLKVFKTVGEPLQKIVASISAGGAIANPTGTLGWLLGAIATVILLYTMFKLLIRLVNSYLHIIFLTITAPFQLLVAALPGRQSIASGWMLSILANVLAFPAVLAVLYFVAFLLGQDIGPLKGISDASSGGIVPTASAQGSGLNIVGNTVFPLFGSIDLTFMKTLLAFGALLATPSIPDAVTRAMGKASQAGELIGREISGGVTTGRGYSDQARQAAAGMGSEVGALYPKYGYQGRWVDDNDHSKGMFFEKSENPYHTQPGGGGKVGGWLDNTKFAQTRAGRNVTRFLGGRGGRKTAAEIKADEEAAEKARKVTGT